MVDINRSLKKMLGPKINIPKFGIPTKRDWDGDGIPNFRDCQPRNIFRQDIVGGDDICFERFLYGNKPVVEFDASEGQLRNYLAKYPSLNNYAYIDYHWGKSYMRIYYKDGEKSRALKIMNINKSLSREGDKLGKKDPRRTKEYHIKMGRLYGYDEKDIDWFIKNMYPDIKKC